MRGNNMKCEKCGYEFESGKFCPECGAPVTSTPEINTYSPQPEVVSKKKEKKKDSTLSTWACILSIFGCTSLIGLVLAIIDLSKKDTEHKHTGSKFAIFMCILYLIVGFNINSKKSDTPVPDTVQTAEADQSADNTDTSADATDTVTEESTTEITIPEEVIYSDHDVIITVTGYTQSAFGDQVNFYIENNSSKNYSINAHSYAVNGIMTGNNIYAMDCDVAAGKKANTSFDIPSDFKELITDVKYITVLFWAYDEDTLMKDFETEPIQINTNLYDGTKDTYSGDTKYSSNGIQVDLLDASDDCYTYVLTNNTGAYFDFDVENTSINDYTVSSVDYDLYNVQILDDSQLLFQINLDDDFATTNGISKIEKLEFSLKVQPEGDYTKEWNTDVILTE